MGGRLRVIKSFDSYQLGDTILTEDFPVGRVPRLIEQRYVAPVSGPDEAGMQPTSDALLGTSVAELPDVLEAVVDDCVIRAALERETRTTAQTYMQRRLKEFA